MDPPSRESLDARFARSYLGPGQRFSGPRNPLWSHETHAEKQMLNFTLDRPASGTIGRIAASLVAAWVRRKPPSCCTAPGPHKRDDEPLLHSDYSATLRGCRLHHCVSGAAGHFNSLASCRRKCARAPAPVRPPSCQKRPAFSRNAGSLWSSTSDGIPWRTRNGVGPSAGFRGRCLSRNTSADHGADGRCSGTPRCN